MKQKLFTLLLAVAASVGTMFAEKVQIGDLYYNLNATNQTAEVTDDGNYSGLTTANIPASVTYSGTTYSVTLCPMVFTKIDIQLSANAR